MNDGPGGHAGDHRGEWVCLFSGGKDSSWALHRAIERNRGVDRLVTVHPPDDAYMYHVPATDVSRIAAESVGLPLVEVDARSTGGSDHDSGRRADAELAPLDDALRRMHVDGPGIAGIVVGAVESEFQYRRVERLCDRFDAALFAPLWHRNPDTLATAMLDAGFEIYIVQVAADGLDERWLGRRLDVEALAELRELNANRGVHLLGEGGEFETLVTDGPHLSRPIRFDGRVEWNGTHGRFHITEAWLA